MEADDKYLTTRHVRARYGGKSEKTVERWIGLGVLPPPDWINGRRYWRLSVLEKHERESMTRQHHKETAA
jgi:hypothetical protein